MFAGLIHHVILSLSLLHVFKVAAFPRPSYTKSDQSLAKKDTTEGLQVPALVEARSPAATDVPTEAQQNQNMYSGAGMNGTTAQPGFIPTLSHNGVQAQVNCSDLTTGRDNKCWDELELTSWLENDWLAYNTCYEGEGFSSCYLRQVGYPELDCTGIKLATCTPPPVIPNQDSRFFYVAYNIYGA